MSHEYRDPRRPMRIFLLVALGLFVLLCAGYVIARSGAAATMPNQLIVTMIGDEYVGVIMMPTEHMTGIPEVIWKDRNLIVRYKTDDGDHCDLTYDGGLVLGPQQQEWVSLNKITKLAFRGPSGRTALTIDLKGPPMLMHEAALYFLGSAALNRVVCLARKSALI